MNTDRKKWVFARTRKDTLCSALAMKRPPRFEYFVKSRDSFNSDWTDNLEKAKVFYVNEDSPVLYSEIHMYCWIRIDEVVAITRAIRNDPNRMEQDNFSVCGLIP